MYGRNEYDKLVGVKITGFESSFKTGDTSITFNCDNGKSFNLTCDADCCSSSWFENIELPAFPFPVTITKAEEVEGPDFSDSWVKSRGYDCVQTYGLRLTTDKGDLYIDMRNNSNGYYGGSFELDLKGLELPPTPEPPKKTIEPTYNVEREFAKIMSDSVIYGSGFGEWTDAKLFHLPIEQWDKLKELKQLVLLGH